MPGDPRWSCRCHRDLLRGTRKPLDLGLVEERNGGEEWGWRREGRGPEPSWRR
ncbi:MAG: hypothetical protein AVDCRST_MAG25-992 [uncultured Rubrobacteraceae bacterium]|uniref:Uncharacterized protein n=1 Tax=uncultured Rubrobacteraceae bacterium TaxID=349277 RepID=A0A6J4R5F4_9ACTN|nr:MAG: hypothetical protein AVDCRST_MAG25-992 [uncultured Rubrobacteraceae bacterium]